MKSNFLKVLVVGLIITSMPTSAAEVWSTVEKVKTIFPQAKRESSTHPHSDKILISLENMNWLPSKCTNRNYFYFEKSDSHFLSLFLSAQTTEKTVQVAVTDNQVTNGICRATMTKLETL